jgi:hypothetical protein
MGSRRQYLTIEELEQFADITITDADEAYDQISQAEELIDAYVGHQDQHVAQPVYGGLTAALSNTFTDTSDDTPLERDDNFFSFCMLQIISGMGAGQERSIVSSSRTGRSVTVGSAFSTQPDTTSVYRIHQLGKFPRTKDTWHDQSNLTFSKFIPEAVRRATAAQVAFIIEMGAEYFAGNDAEASGERIGNYSYYRLNNNQSAAVKMLAPRARTLLRGIKNSLGKLQADNPTCL